MYIDHNILWYCYLENKILVCFEESEKKILLNAAKTMGHLQALDSGAASLAQDPSMNSWINIVYLSQREGLQQWVVEARLNFRDGPSNLLRFASSKLINTMPG